MSVVDTATQLSEQPKRYTGLSALSDKFRRHPSLEQSRQPEHETPPSTGRDSGYSSRSGTQEAISDGTTPLSGHVDRSPSHPMAERPPTQAEINRFRDLWLLLGPQLVELTLCSKQPCRPCSAKLRVHGPTAEAVRPCIVVLCDKSVAKKVRKLMAKKVNEEQLKPAPSMMLPIFNILIEERPPVRFNGGDVDSDSVSIEIDSKDIVDTVCGAKVRCRSNEMISSAVLGGMLWVTGPEGTRAYGLTVAHIVGNSDLEDFDPLLRFGSDDSDDSTDESEDDDSAGSGRYIRSTAADLSSLIHPWADAVGTTQRRTTTSADEEWETLGRLLMPNNRPRPVHRGTPDLDANLDWALVQQLSSQFILPNVAPLLPSWLPGWCNFKTIDEIFSFAAIQGRNADIGTFAAFVIRRLDSVCTAVVSPVPVFLFLPPTKHFVEAYVLKVDPADSE
jgi:hypothetical protein